MKYLTMAIHRPALFALALLILSAPCVRPAAAQEGEWPGGLAPLPGFSGGAPEAEEILTPANAINQTQPFEDGKLYNILTHPSVPTHIVLGDDEDFKGLYIGDDTRWVIHENDPHIFVKPSMHGISTLANIVTSKRTYSMLLIAGEIGDQFHYRVSWDYPSLVAAEAGRVKEQRREERIAALVAKAVKKSEDEEAHRRELDRMTIERDRDLASNMYTGYEIKGHSSIRPALIMDNGRQTYMLFRNAELPAIYARDGGEDVLPNFTAGGETAFTVVDRVAEEWKFVLGDRRASAMRADPIDGEDDGQ